MQSCKKTDIPNVRRFEVPHVFNTYFIDQDSLSSAYGTDASRTTSLQKTSSTEVLEEDMKRGRSHDSGMVGERPKSREIQRRNSGRRQRPVVKTANKCTVDRSRAKSEGKREPLLHTPLPPRNSKKVVPITFAPTPYKTNTPRVMLKAPNHVVRRNSSNTSSDRGRTTAIHRKSSSCKRNERPTIITRSNSRKQKLVEPRQIRHDVRHANKISTATHNKETTV